MNLFLSGVVRSLVETFEMPEPILEVGSYQVAGQEQLIDLRGLFPNKNYIGMDMRSGPGVDQVGDVENLPFADKSIGTVISVSTFEHVPRFWRGFEEVQRVLRPDGAFVVACPFFFRIHNYPSDYWRFSPEAFKLLLEPYPNKILGWHGARNRPANVWSLALGEQAEPITQKQFKLYRQRLAQYAHEPLSLSRRIRYAVGRALCSRGPFASYLDQNRWETTFQTTTETQAPSSKSGRSRSQPDAA